ncbi:GMC oxidoreductase [Pleomassaria siparia CBS 279.74]|uniref:GMC oxidoreductase n=1 Tax=Pleomassaria siparia CBS 279.74 TaxID=1314801 RepID=A0A6G1K694_9PLEO|nr:GMC oxidoreductase [Pleomassaria siparia CBS 279.74]
MMILSLSVAVAFVGALVPCSLAVPLRIRADQVGTPGDATFDYVVIGGGTAGLTIAARLSEFASVAVIEAGGYYQTDYGNASVVPLLSLTGIDVIDPSETFPHRPEIDWELVTQPQTNAGGRKVHYAQGKTLGGSSALNTMSYVRSSASAYQRWADLVGDNSYTFDNLLPYFKKSVRLTPPNLTKRNAVNATPEYDTNSFGAGSPLDVSWNNWVDPTITWLAKSLQSIGLAINPKGWSSGQLNGGSWVPSTIDPAHATRESSQTSFLDYAAGNTRLVVYPHSMASKILFKGTTATGVSVNTAGTTYTLSASKEIIVSAGVFHSPQLLMVSGVGPKATLESKSIAVVADLPGVGQNLRDPVSVNVAHFVSTTNAQGVVANPVTQPEALRQYQEDAAGPYSSAAGYISYERLTNELRSTLLDTTRAALAKLPSDSPEVQFIAGTFLWTNGSAMGSMSATICNTFSRGSVTISSSNASDAPVIDLGWFSDPADGDVLVAGIKRLRQAWASDPAQSISLGAEVIPGDSVSTDEQLLAFVKANANMIWHPSSTCSMGKQGDADAVVDSQARVFGVQRLRVVDISIFPLSIPGHPQASVYMVAEKIADIIKKGGGVQ